MRQIADEDAQPGSRTPRGSRPSDRSAPGDWLAELRAIVSAVEASDVHELDVRTPTLRVSLRRQWAADAPGRPGDAAADQGADEDVVPSSWQLLRSPLTGIWYDSPSPGAGPFVSLGDTIAAGATIGLVETMKVFNEITADVAGIVRQIFVERGDLVAAHAPLIAVEPSGGLPGSETVE